METRKTVTTVTGDIPLEDLGVTLTHEHIHMTFDSCFVSKPSSVINWPSSRTENSRESFALNNLGLLRQYPYSFPYNLKLNDDDTKNILEDELLRYKVLGGRTIVENTIHGLSRNAKLLKDLSVKTGVNIVSGTGFYIAKSLSQAVLETKLEQIYDQMLNELEVGDEIGIKCGIIGEIGCSWPLHDFERRTIEAVAMLQESTTKPITFHAARHKKSPFEIIRLFFEAGGRPDGVVMSHLDRTLFEDEDLLAFADLKVFNQFDLFGTEVSFYQFNPEVDMVSDAHRIRKIRMLVENGHLDKILMSHDIHTKHRLVNFGGHGYGHILQNVIPMMRNRGFTDTEVDTLMIENPKRWLRGSGSGRASS